MNVFLLFVHGCSVNAYSLSKPLGHRVYITLGPALSIFLSLSASIHHNINAFINIQPLNMSTQVNAMQGGGFQFRGAAAGAGGGGCRPPQGGPWRQQPTDRPVLPMRKNRCIRCMATDGHFWRNCRHACYWCQADAHQGSPCPHPNAQADYARVRKAEQNDKRERLKLGRRNMELGQEAVDMELSLGQSTQDFRELQRNANELGVSNGQLRERITQLEEDVKAERDRAEREAEQFIALVESLQRQVDELTERNQQLTGKEEDLEGKQRILAF